MINKNLFHILSNELNAANDSVNPEIVERLNLASIILNDNYLSVEVMSDYLRWKRGNDDSQNALLELFSKFLYSKKSNGEEAGIYPFLRKMVSIINQIKQTDEYSSVKSPSKKAELMDAEISAVQDKLIEYNAQIAELNKRTDELKQEYELLKAREAECSAQLDEYERLKKEYDSIQARLDEFNTINAELSIDELSNQTIALQEKFEAAKKQFKDNQDLEQYYSLLVNISKEYNILNQITMYRKIVAEISEDTKIGNAIVDNVVNINVSALRSVILKIEPFFEELKKELKSVVEQLENI